MCCIATSAPGSAPSRKPPNRPGPGRPSLHVTLANGAKAPLDTARLALIVNEACAGFDGVDAAPVIAETQRNLYDGIGEGELALASVMAARTLVEQEPNYAYVSAQLLLDKLRTEVLSFVVACRPTPRRPIWPAVTPNISRPISRPASGPNCSSLIWPAST